MIAFLVLTIKLHIKFSKPDKDGNTLYYEKDDRLIIPMIFAGIISLFIVILFMISVNDFASAMFNPEYWAIKKILCLIKN